MKYFYTIFFIIVTYLAVGSSAIRYFVYDIESHASKVSNYIENNIEKNIKISSLKGYWQGLNPKISFNASKVSDNKDLGQIIVQLNLFQTLSTFQPVIKYIFVDGLNMSLNFSDSKNAFSLPGTMIIRNSNIKMEYEKNKYEFSNLNVDYNKSFIGIKSNVSFKKNKFSLNGIINITNKNIKDFVYNKDDISLSGNLHIQGSVSNNIFKALKIETPLVFNNLDVDSYHQFEISKSRILKYKINHKNTNNADIFIKDNNINKLNNLILDGSYSNTATKSIYDIDNLKFKNNFDNFTFKNIILQKTEDLKILNLYAEKIDVKNFNFLLSKYNSYFTDIRDKFKVTEGSLSDLLINYNYEHNKLFSSFTLDNVSLDYLEYKLKNLSAKVLFLDNLITMKLNSDKLELSSDKIFRGPLNLINTNVDIKTDLSKGTHFINILNLSNKDISFKGNILLDLNNDFIHLNTSINSSNIKSLPSIFPKTIMGENISSWINKSFIRGKVNEGFIFMKGALSTNPFYHDYSGISYANLNLNDLNIKYSLEWPSIKLNNAVVKIKNKNFSFETTNEKIYSSNIKKLRVSVDDMNDATLETKAIISGPIKDFVIYNKDAFNLKINPNDLKDVSGNITSHLDFIFLKSKNSNIYNASFDLNNASYKNKYIEITQVNGSINLKENLITLNEDNYLNGLINGNKTNVKIKSLSSNKISIFGSSNIDYSSLNVEFINQYIKGKSLWNFDFEINLSNFDNNLYKASSNLVGSEMNFPYLFTKKNKNNHQLNISYYKKNNFDMISLNYDKIVSLINITNTSGFISFNDLRRDIPKQNFNLYGNIEYLNLNEISKHNKNDIDLTKYINQVSLKIKQLKKGDFIFNNSVINLTKKKKSLFLNEFSSVSNSYNLFATGEHDINNLSRIDLTLDSTNLQRVLDDWKIEHGIRDGTLSLNSNIQWSGGFNEFNINNIDGSLNLSLSNGRIKKVGSRATRLLGLLNFDLLTKRLSLDFDDVTKNGFYFDNIAGDFRIDNGSLYSTNLITQGPSAQILVIGSTNYVNETYDATVIATPEVSKTLPAFALIGGPIAAAATYAAEKIAKALGKDIDDLIKVKYSVKGTWNKPKIEVIEKNFDPLKEIKELFN